MLLPTMVPVIMYSNGSAIYLSSIHPVIEQTQELQNEEIRVVISLLEELNVPPDIHDALKDIRGLRHYYYNIKDTCTESIDKIFLGVYGIISRALDNEKRVLIYCRSGQSSCVTILISFLILSLYKGVFRHLVYNYVDFIPKSHFNWTETFLNYIQTVYPQGKPNDAFLWTLMEFEYQLLN